MEFRCCYVVWCTKQLPRLRMMMTHLLATNTVLTAPSEQATVVLFPKLLSSSI